MTLKPLYDRVLVKPIEEELKKGSIIIPDTAKERPQQGEIIDAGEGRMTDDGKIIPLKLKKGDRILFAKYARTEFEIGDEKFLVMRESDALAIIEL